MKTERSIRDYEDILYLKRPVSRKHPPMPPMNRAAQFSPFAALNGYEEQIGETARRVERKILLSEEEEASLNRCLCELETRLGEKPPVTVTYFVPDPFKEGGSYVTARGTVKRIDSVESLLLLHDGTRIPLGDILSLDPEEYQP